ncbi:type II and III secretion system protein family protein [Aestuariivirga sp.]|uniref:type II and III secretion system protein family protein n=1 Tax=Aestuariivirga sp. TaxID=2650926 RepID=UPI00391D8F16
MPFTLTPDHLIGKRSWRAKASLVAAAVMALGSSASLLPHAAKATDADVVESSGARADSRYLRLGLSKSAVIKLPAAAKDVVVGDNAVVDVVLRNRNTAYLFARAPGQTNVFFFDAEGREILHLDFEVTLDTKGLKKLIDRSLPGNQIEVDSTGPNVVLKGTAANAQEAKLAVELAKSFVVGTSGTAANSGDDSVGVLNLLKIAEGDQVMLKVRVVELKRTVLKELGVNVGAEISVGNFFLDFNSNTVPISNDTVLDAVGGYLSSDVKVAARIRALENQGLATVLAEPTLTAISGAPARFHAGGEYPYTVCEVPENNVTLCNVEFKPYGISLDFTPTVLSEGRIALNIRTEVSELGDTTPGSQPAIDTRNAQTSLEIPSGGSMMLAGLIKDVTAQSLDATPGLRSIPVLGALFSSRAYQNDQSELVVIVTPYIVNPTHESKLATPTDGFNPPTDLQQIFLSRLNRIYGPPGEHPNGIYHGQIGYIVE